MWGFSYANNKRGCGSARDCLVAECVRDHSPQDNQPALEGWGEGRAEKTEGWVPCLCLACAHLSNSNPNEIVELPPKRTAFVVVEVVVADDERTRIHSSSYFH